MNRIFDLLGAKVKVVNLGPACRVAQEAPMVNVLRKLGWFPSRRTNIDITPDRVEIGNIDGVAAYPDHGDAPVTMWEYVVENEAMGENPDPRCVA
jgi:hypothetical protein